MEILGVMSLGDAVGCIANGSWRQDRTALEQVLKHLGIRGHVGASR